eukprot:XP_014039971.1 PREDICTED: protein VAC14 homolog [Salmo salar]
MNNPTFIPSALLHWKILVCKYIPDINLLDYLPEILDGLFQILGHSSTPCSPLSSGCYTLYQTLQPCSWRAAVVCEVVLGEFLKEIKKSHSSVKFAEMANILVIHCQVSESELSYSQ